MFAVHRVLFVLLLSLAVGCAGEKSTPTVLILGAASTKDLLEELSAAARKSIDHPVEIEISTGPSHALAQQILSGAPADIYVSANHLWADKLVDAGHAEQSNDWLSNGLVVVVPADSKLQLSSPADLDSDQINRLAIAGENVPAGIYAQQSLTFYKLWDKLNADGKIVHGHDVRSTLTYAEHGEVDAAIVYATDARLTDRVRVVLRLDPESHRPIVYPLVRLRTKHPSPEADLVFQFFQTQEAAQIAEKFGFVTLKQPQVGE